MYEVVLGITKLSVVGIIDEMVKIIAISINRNTNKWVINDFCYLLQRYFIDNSSYHGEP